jgi:hypothetical protein
MSDLFVAFMFSSMVITPCMVARAICISKDRSRIVIVRSTDEARNQTSFVRPLSTARAR